MPEENHPPLFDHTFWGVGNEDRIERRASKRFSLTRCFCSCADFAADWALRAIGKMNGLQRRCRHRHCLMLPAGTLIEAMIANGTIASESEVCSQRVAMISIFPHFLWQAIDPALIAEIHQAQHEQVRVSSLTWRRR
eukprot:640939-Hanusia_phi.AAC.1